LSNLYLENFRFDSMTQKQINTTTGSKKNFHEKIIKRKSALYKKKKE